MNQLSLIVGVSAPLLFAFASTARAGSIWQWTHQASGGGTANVFDGGPTLSDFEETTALDDPSMGFGVNDRTQPGSLGAGAFAVGRSRILGDSADSFGVSINYTVGYSPSSFVGGDNPGGEGEGSLSSVIEFVVPVDDVTWAYDLDIDTDPTSAFTGSTDIMLENISRPGESRVFAKNPPGGALVFDFDAVAGDLIRLTTEMSGAGGTPAARRSYDTSFVLSVLVPEPGTLSFLLVSIAMTRRRRRAAAVSNVLASPVIGGVA
jgi:hypothetical protein